MANQILLRRGASIAGVTAVAASGEPLYESGTGYLYIGDGTTQIQNLTPISGLGFGNIAVGGQNTIVADQPSDTVTFVGSGITITTDDTTDTVTFTVSGAGTMDNFLVSGDLGDASDTIGDAETLNINGGVGISTTLTAASNTIDINFVGIPDTSALVVGSADSSKQIRFEVDGLTTATTRVITMPDQDIDLTPGSTYADATHNHDADYVNVGGDTMTGNLTLNDNVVLNLGSGLDVKQFFNATSYITELEGVNWIIRDSVDAAIVTITHATKQVDFAGGVVVDGDLTVNGTTTTINTTELLVEDNLITLNSTFAGASPTANAGIEIERGTQTNATLQWNETADYWEVDLANGSFNQIATTDMLSSYLAIADIDDVPVDGATTTAISSNWAFDHANGADPHSVYPLQGGAETITGVWDFTNATFDGGSF